MTIIMGVMKYDGDDDDGDNDDGSHSCTDKNNNIMSINSSNVNQCLSCNVFILLKDRKGHKPKVF